MQMPQSSHSRESFAHVSPEAYKGMLAMGEALARRRYAKVDYLSRKYQKCFPQYAGYYQEQEALACKRRGYAERALTLFRAANEFFGGGVRPTVLNLIRELEEQKQFEEAQALLCKALQDFPDDDALRLEGIYLLFEQGRIQDALRVLRVRCADEDAPVSFWNLRAKYSFELGLYEESRAALAVCRKRYPEASVPWCNDIFRAHYMPDVSGEALRDLIRRCYEATCGSLTPTEPAKLRRTLNPAKRLRIGLVSAGFHVHPVGWMSACALRLLRRIPGYELYFYSTDKDTLYPADFSRRAFRAASSKWTEAGNWTEDALYQRMLDDKLDLALDMCGHAQGAVLSVFARRVAPVQIRWVGGLVNTTGIPAMDYLLSDRYETPDGCDDEYTEKLVRLPHSYIAYTPPDYGKFTDPVARPDDAPICFGCFNNAYKLNPVIAGVWAEILRRVPGSTLFLRTDTLEKAEIRDRVLGLFKDHAIDPQRIRCEGVAAHHILLACYDDVDIALDPWPYTGGLTTLEALWKGVPVITTPGPSFAGRHALSHLCNMGLQELVADSFEEYIELAVKLAGNRALLRDLRYLLPVSLLKSPLTRHEQLAADLHTAFRAMWKRHCEGLPPVAMRFEQPSSIPEQLEPFILKTEE